MLFVNFDFAISLQKSFQDPATPLMEGIIDLHHHICFFLIVVICLVVWVLFSIVDHFHFHRYFIHSSNNLSMLLFLNRFEKTRSFTHHSVLEIIWTIIPSLILVLIAIPSFTLLYSIDEIINPEITFKVLGHQWYWSYEFDDFNNSEDFFDYEFDSYMIPTEYLEEDALNLRLLEVDAPLYLPLRTHIRVIVTSSDVLHAWAVPSLGVKIDAVPGRLNQVSLFIKRAGTFYGQCSEICGVNHGFMPIVIHAVPQDIFQKLIA